MNEALMLSPRWVSVSTSAVRLKQRVENTDQTFSFCMARCEIKTFFGEKNKVYLLRAVGIDF